VQVAAHVGELEQARRPAPELALPQLGRHERDSEHAVDALFVRRFRERLEPYAPVRGRLDRLGEASQDEIDRVFSLLRTQGTAGLPKGISAPTLSLVAERVREAAGEVTAAEIADRAGISRGTARRYLDYLASSGALELRLRYGTTGRPEHLYRYPGAVGAT